MTVSVVESALWVQQRGAGAKGAGHTAKISWLSGLGFDREPSEGHVISNNWELRQQPIHTEGITCLGPQERSYS